MTGLLFSIYMVLEYINVCTEYKYIHTHMHWQINTPKYMYELPHEISCSINKAAQVSNDSEHLKVLATKRDLKKKHV